MPRLKICGLGLGFQGVGGTSNSGLHTMLKGQRALLKEVLSGGHGVASPPFLPYPSVHVLHPHP